MFGTKTISAHGNVKSISGRRNKPNSALEFVGAGSYLHVILGDECLTNPDRCNRNGVTLSFMASFSSDVKNWTEKVYIFDSIGSDFQKLRGVSVYVENKQIYFLISTISSYCLLNVPLSADETWRHYAMTWNSNVIVIYINGKATKR